MKKKIVYATILGFFGYAKVTSAAGLVICGTGKQRMCELCDLIVGINNLIRYGFGIATVVALAAITIGAVMYIISAGNPGDIEKAKSVMKDAGWGFVIIFAAGFIVTVTMNIIGAKQNLGISKISGWNKFECTRRE